MEELDLPDDNKVVETIKSTELVCTNDYRLVQKRWDMIRLIQTKTSRHIKKKFLILKKHYWDIDNFWLKEYFVSIVGITISNSKQYISHKGNLDTSQTTTLFD